jgi:hypothetical protein
VIFRPQAFLTCYFTKKIIKNKEKNKKNWHKQTKYRVINISSVKNNKKKFKRSVKKKKLANKNNLFYYYYFKKISFGLVWFRFLKSKTEKWAKLIFFNFSIKYFQFNIFLLRKILRSWKFWTPNLDASYTCILN